MKRLLLLAMLLSACASVERPGEVTSDVTRTVPNWVGPNFTITRRSVTAPQFEEPEIIFKIIQGGCSHAADAHAISDCTANTSRSSIRTGKAWEEAVDLQVGQRHLFSFEFWIDPKLRYLGYENAKARQTGRRSSTLSIARWGGQGATDPTLFDLKVDATRGVTFMGKTCIPPSEFGSWHRFNLRVRWADDGTGFLEVRCDGSLHSGPPIYAKSDFRTNQPLQCLKEEGCDPNAAKDPKRFEVELGIIHGPEFKNGRARPPRVGTEGLSIKLRRVIVRRLFVIFGRQETL